MGYDMPNGKWTSNGRGWGRRRRGGGVEMVDALAREEGVPASVVSVDNW